MNEHSDGEVQIQEAQEVNVDARGSLGVPGAIVLGSALIAASIYFGLLNVAGGGSLFPDLGTDSGAVTPPSTPTAPGAPSGPVDVSAGDTPILGEANAPVLVVEWSDYQCPFCKRTFDTVEPAILEYVKRGEVAFAYRDFAFLGQPSIDSAAAARCANDQDKFWEYHDILFEKHPGSGHGDHLDIDDLKQYAVDLGLNAATFNSCLDSEKYVDAVTADTSAGRTAGVNGTPTTFINGRVLNGAQAVSAFTAMIDEELAK